MRYAVVFSLLLSSIAYGAGIPAPTVWEVRTTGLQANGGGFVWQSLVSSTFTWTASGSGTNEYYAKKGAGACTGTKPLSVTCDGSFNLAEEGAVGSLTAGQWAWGDNETPALGFNTVYVRLSSGLDPDTQNPSFVAMSQGTDYSQQDAAADTGTDLACADGDAANPVISSASHNFVAADVNNVIHITEAGDGFNVGWYHIVSTNANNATLDRPCGSDGAKSGGDWSLGGAFLLGGALDDDWSDALTAGNTTYWKDGAYTLGETVSMLTAGTAVLPISFRGYKTTRGDAPTASADQPTLSIGSTYSWTTSAYPDWRYISIDGTSSNHLFTSGGNGFFGWFNGNNTTSTASKVCFITASGDRLFKCNFTTPNSATSGAAIRMVADVVLQASSIHDSLWGVSYSTSGGKVIGCAIYGCTIGINVGSSALISVDHCVIYDNTTGISGSTSYASTFTNNIISNNTTGAAWTTATPNNFWANNCWNNTTDRSLVAIGLNEVTGDPLFTAPSATPPDFTLQASSPCLAVGAGLGTEVGLTGDYKVNIGADQDDNAASSSTIVITGKNGGKQ